jgi:IclR family transcriptional regulator, KDG regulon repressor
VWGMSDREKVPNMGQQRIGGAADAMNAGLRSPPHDNAPGMVLLAFQPHKKREPTVRRPKLERSTARTLTDREALRQKCESVLKLGYGTDWGEADEDIHCVATPVLDRPAHLLALVWPSTVALRSPKDNSPKVAAEFPEAARMIERRLRA